MRINNIYARMHLRQVLLVLAFFYISPSFLKASGNAVSMVSAESGIIIKGPGDKGKLKQWLFKLKNKAENDKAVLAGLTITLGVFGVHRLYLGTSPHVPVLYTLTIGGGFGLVPLIDLIHILAVKDPERFKEDHRFFMWWKRDKQEGD